LAGAAGGGMGMGMDMFGGAGAGDMLSLGNLDMSSFGFGGGNGAGGFGLGAGNLEAQMQMCEVEIPGGVLLQGMQGDEDELLMRTNNAAGGASGVDSTGYYSSLPSSAATSGMLFSATTSTTSATDFSTDVHSQQQQQWRPPHSAYGAVGSAPSPPPGSLPHGILQRNNSLRGMHSSSSSSSSVYPEDYSAASLSAPSHKQSFDHASLYPPGMMDTGGVGPARRHRSMTPSLVRNGEPRRPLTANSDFSNGSPGSVHSTLSSASGAGAAGQAAQTRGYHPYAYSASNSRTNSTTNSPQIHSIPLGGGSATDYGGMRRSDSRSSSYSNTGASGLHEQMRQMMNMDPSSAGANNSGANGNGPSSAFVDGMFRTDSPAQFAHQIQTDSPAAFSTMDLPMHHGYGHASTMPQFSSSSGGDQGFDASGFYPQQHTTL